MSDEIEKSDDWKLRNLSLEFNIWGDDKGKYTGDITFSNGENESFSFKIKPDMAERYIDLIADDVVRGARSLSDRLIKSLKLNEREGR